MGEMSLAFVQVDVFTDTPFAGNAAVVIPLEGWPADDWMQKVAREMNVSGTAFVVRDDGRYELRFFTPAVEVELSGHTTLATAHALYSEGQASAPELCFSTKGGELRARRKKEWIELELPADAPRLTDPPPDLLESLAVTATRVGRGRYDYLVEVASESIVRSLSPDFGKLRQVETRGVMVTARADTEEVDFVSRFFAPRAGIDEDPVTGSAHCCLGPYWKQKLDKDELVAYQASPRGGTVRLRVGDDRVVLAGQAVTVLRGEFLA